MFDAGELTKLQNQILGNGKLTEAEERTHFGLWAIAKSPIIMGTDMTKLSSTLLNLIKNKVRQSSQHPPNHTPKPSPILLFTAAH